MHIKKVWQILYKNLHKKACVPPVEWTDVAKWVSLFIPNAHRLRLTWPDLTNSSLWNTRRRTTAQRERPTDQKENEKSSQGPTAEPDVWLQLCCPRILFFFFFFTLLIILVKPKKCITRQLAVTWSGDVLTNIVQDSRPGLSPHDLWASSLPEVLILFHFFFSSM